VWRRKKSVKAQGPLERLSNKFSRSWHMSARVAELQEEQLALHQQATVEAAAAAKEAKVTIESLIAEAEAARAKAMSEKGGAAAAVSALTARAKLAGMWREKVDHHNTGAIYERIERVMMRIRIFRAPRKSSTTRQMVRSLGGRIDDAFLAGRGSYQSRRSTRALRPTRLGY
jgi:hypothetical protein